MWIDYRSGAVKFKVGDFILFFPTSIKFETFNDPENYYGIIFFQDKCKYQVLESKIGIRLLINGSDGTAKDLPFHDGTSHFLPDFVKIKNIKEFANKGMV